MSRIFFMISVLFFVHQYNFAQTDIRAWYARGQVFIVWKTALPVEETFAIHASASPFSNTDNAVLIGRPFDFEYLGYGLKENLGDNTATYVIPDGQGSLYQLALNEGLFVFTPHQSGSLYFSVTKWGDKNAVSGQNRTESTVNFRYDPVNEPVQCHLQKVFPSPFTNGYTCFAYIVWADGRQDPLDGRADFPVMANTAKNGMPGLFLVSAPNDLDTTKLFPMSVWLHGGGGNARQSLAGSRKEVNINPEIGILVAHDDKMYGYRGPVPPHPDQPTWHFGYAKNYNPFIPEITLSQDTVINYTQRRYIWVDGWISRHYNIDTNRIHIHGHSMGSAGAIGLLKCFPRHYASGTIFNTGCAGPVDTLNTLYIFGTKGDNFPTNLYNRSGKRVQMYDLWDLYTNCSPDRDIPLIRHWHGKNDDNGTMRWSPAVVRNYIVCDSLATGIHNFWSERPHGMDLAPAFNDHWIQGITPQLQTESDNVSFPESRFRSDVSFPAFYNHRLDNKNNHPGTGLIGVNNGDGDNWGTWGGYFRWTNPVETPDTWQVTAWLEGKSVFLNDRCPDEYLTSGVAVRRPVFFLPLEGEKVFWRTEDFLTGAILQSGSVLTGEDGLVRVVGIDVYEENTRKIRIILERETSSAPDISKDNKKLKIWPNPGFDMIRTDFVWKRARVFDVTGKMCLDLSSDGNQKSIDIISLDNGYYILDILTQDDKISKVAFVKL